MSLTESAPPVEEAVEVLSPTTSPHGVTTGSCLRSPHDWRRTVAKATVIIIINEVYLFPIDKVYLFPDMFRT